MKEEAEETDDYFEDDDAVILDDDLSGDEFDMKADESPIDARRRLEELKEERELMKLIYGDFEYSDFEDDIYNDSMI